MLQGYGVAAAVLLPLLCSAEMFSAVTHFQKALDAEQEIAKELKSFISRETERLEELKRIAQDFESHASEVSEDVERHLSHPVKAFLLAKRFTTDWEDVEDLLDNNKIVEEFRSQISTLRDSLPSNEDREGSVTALLRLQDTYKLDVRDIAQGGVVSKNTSPVLNAQQCFEIGQVAYNNQDYYHTVLWMQEALYRDERELNKTASRPVILDYIAFATSQQGNTRHALTLTNELLQIVPSHERAVRNKLYFEKELAQDAAASRRRGDEGSMEDVTDSASVQEHGMKIKLQDGTQIKLERSTDDYHKSDEFLQYEALCRGEKIIKNPYEHKLVCRYSDNGGNPMLVLSPAKVEEVYLDPYIVLFHDSLSDSEMKYLKNLARPRLNRATVQNPTTGKLEAAAYRVSKSAWLKDSEDALVRRITKRVEAMTGLNQETSEELQMNNYGIGGQYEPHYDHSRPEEAGSFAEYQGNRIATWLTYMSDVDAGGATVFVYLGLSLFPVKGASVFWYNLHASGDGDNRTRHAGCPVLAGSKWVSNKWIHERGQEFRRRCALDPTV